VGVEQRFTAVQKDPAAEGAQQQLAAFALAEIERIITDNCLLLLSGLLAVLGIALIGAAGAASPTHGGWLTSTRRSPAFRW
jgi:hypothetical protein